MRIDPDADGIVEIYVFSAQHDNPHRGRPVRVYRFQCRWADAQNVADAWKANNPGLQPADIRFSLGYAILH